MLLPLYKRFYEGDYGCSIVTDEIIEECGLRIAENSLQAHIIELEKRGCIRGYHDLSANYPINIGIDALGISFVERHNQEFAKQHGTLRFRILSLLYDVNFGGHAGDWINVDSELSADLGLTDADNNLLHGELIYLEWSGFIEGTDLRSVTEWHDGIRIDSSGIQLVESIIEDSLQQVTSSSLDQNIKDDAEKISRESDRSTRIEKFRDLVAENSEVIELVANVIRAAIIG